MKRVASIKEKKSKKKKLGFSRSTLFLGEKKEQNQKFLLYCLLLCLLLLIVRNKHTALIIKSLHSNDKILLDSSL
jgi:hypothetical protein